MGDSLSYLDNILILIKGETTFGKLLINTHKGSGQYKMQTAVKPLKYWTPNRPFSYCRYWTGTSLELRLMREVFSSANEINLFSIIFRRMSLHCKLNPVQYRENENGLLIGHLAWFRN